MKKIWLMTLICVLLGTVSCSKDDNEKTIYTVTFDADGGSPTPASQQVEAGGTVTAPTTNPAKPGYVFSYWYLNNSTTAYLFQTPINNNITLRAKWQEESTAEYWQVTWNLNGGTWPTDDNHGTQVLKGGTLAEPNAPVKSGNTFEGWYKEAALTNKINFPYDTRTVTDNFTLYAKWTTGGEEPSTPPTVLYIVGTDDSSVYLWAVDLATDDIVRIPLTAYGEANNIVIANDDLYISGFRTNTTGKHQTCYWKNGEMILLTEAGKDFQGTAIAVSGNDIYVTGNDYNGSGTKPCYWKNGVLTTLSSSAQYAWATDISISGNDVYISGGNDSTDPCYWKNGTRTSLTKQTYSQAEAQANVVSGTDMYTAGRVRYPGDWRACYWKNNSLTTLTDGMQTANANDIVVSNGKVYVGGYEASAACYWENGRKVALEQSTSPSSYVHGIAVAGNNVYAAGSIWNNNDKEVACYWKNGTRVTLSDGKKHAKALAIALSWE